MTANLSLKERLKQRFQKFRQSGAGVLFKSNTRYESGGYREALRSPPLHLISGMGVADTESP